MAQDVNTAHIIWRRTQVQAAITQGLWPKPVSLGARAVGWPAREVDAINAARIAGKSDDAIRVLVARLEAERGEGSRS